MLNAQIKADLKNSHFRYSCHKKIFYLKKEYISERPNKVKSQKKNTAKRAVSDCLFVKT